MIRSIIKNLNKVLGLPYNILKQIAYGLSYVLNLNFKKIGVLWSIIIVCLLLFVDFN